MQKRFVLLITALCSVYALARADEGMWLPWNLGKTQIEKMQQMGLELSPGEIYNTRETSLKDAIVSLDSGSCSGSFISQSGLLLTNHHCAFSEIQTHSSLTNDYLKKGFWAKNLSDELPNPGKTASVLLRVDDVTALFQEVLDQEMNNSDRERKTDSITALITDTASQKGRFTARVKDFYYQNQFFLFVSETFKDVRLVAAPPENLGQFGGDLDNWTWPRHSADFALFRVYAAADGTPADYSPTNVPYKPKKHLSIATQGSKQDDFTMILGYPGETQRFITSFGIEEATEILNPVVADVRSIKQKIWKDKMHDSPLIGIQYADKYATSSNYQKYASGQIMSIREGDLLLQREELEQRFGEWVEASDSSTRESYHQVVASAGLLYLLRQNLAETSITTLETLINGPDINAFILEGFALYSALKQSSSDEKITRLTNELKKQGPQFFRDFDASVDRQVFKAMIEYYRQNLGDSSRMSDAQIFAEAKDLSTLSETIYSQSIFTDPARFNAFLAQPQFAAIENDPGFRFMMRVVEYYAPVYTIFNRFESQLELTMGKYVKGLMAMQPDRDFYPDANSTLRLTYGKIGAYTPRDGILYKAFSSQKGLIEKVNSGNSNYELADSLISLYKRDNFGPYQMSDHELPLCFISDNDITGGNSGSAVLNARGQIVGLAFDGNREGMSSDMAYIQGLQKCVSVDVRHILYLIEELGDASHLTEEMSFVD